MKENSFTPTVNISLSEYENLKKGSGDLDKKIKVLRDLRKSNQVPDNLTASLRYSGGGLYGSSFVNVKMSKTKAASEWFDKYKIKLRKLQGRNEWVNKITAAQDKEISKLKEVIKKSQRKRWFNFLNKGR